VLVDARQWHATFLEAWHGHIGTSADERVRDVGVDAGTPSVALMDGHTITVPLAWFPRLLDATPAERARWEPAGAGLRHPLAGRGRGRR
jgi:hypothetical protein